MPTELTLQVTKVTERQSLETGEQPPKRKVPPSLARSAKSQNPRADIYYGTPQRDPFLEELALISASAFMQVQPHNKYHDRYGAVAENNRRDLDKTRHIEQKRAFKRRAKNTTTTLQAPTVSGDGRARLLPKASTENGTLGSLGDLA